MLKTRAAPLALLLVLAPLPAAAALGAQSADEILGTALERHEARVAEVENRRPSEAAMPSAP